MAKKRRKHDGSTEVVSPCPLCGDEKHYETNTRTGLSHCWVCHYGNKTLLESISEAPQPKAEEPRRLELSKDFPSYVFQEWAKRGLDKQWILKHYNPSWTGTHIAWSCYGGSPWLRSVFPWQEPKVKTTGVKGLLVPSGSLVDREAVLVEGDYKATAIPQPWVGIAIGGTTLSGYQRQLLLSLRLSSCLVLLDGGKEKEALAISKTLGPFAYASGPSGLSPGLGPDDVPRRVLIRLLLVLAKDKDKTNNP